MAQLPILSAKDVIKALVVLGYREIRQRGSHIRLACAGRKSITVPNYKTIDRALLRKILRDADLDVDAFLKLL